MNFDESRWHRTPPDEARISTAMWARGAINRRPIYLAQTQARASRAAASCTDEEADPCTTRGGGVLWGGGGKGPPPPRTKEK